ncbi:vesicle-trafficking protein SEC22a-like [Gigantopelta aegis]|uniref:vesicle-trafficking protein SEC22a-like n=1 Tax=Gigantopelta aegis TaxID=1735272 RepID=UPI001B88BFE4|nr:vesicle-trafficking protein SEC22a-like [Gigantopelta aegis]
MIYFSLISRISDGLPLAGTTDVSYENDDPDFKLAYKELKRVIRKCDKFPDRCTYTPSTYSIHFISALGLTFSVICDSSYPTVLAFSFLDEIQKEFLQQYETEKREKATRPYTFVEFDTFLQKAKTRYKHPRTLTTKLDLTTLSQEIRLRPPYNISPEEVNPPVGNFVLSTSFRTSATSHRHFVPLGLFGWVTVAMNVFCSCLNLARAILLMNEGHIDDFDSEVYQFGALFLLCCLFFSYQVYLMCWPTNMRKPLACATLGSICLCQLYLWEHRTSIQMLFHITVSCTATFVIFTRQIQEKLPQYNL